MTQRVALINGKNKNQDYDLAKIFQSLGQAGVSEGLEVQSGKVTKGFGFVNITRDGKTFPVLFTLDSDLDFNTSGNKKIFIEINLANINDGSINNPDGTGIGEIKTATSYPSNNYLKLAIISNGTITDNRKIINLKSISGIIESETDLEIKNANGDLKKINVSELLINGSPANQFITKIAGEDISVGDAIGYLSLGIGSSNSFSNTDANYINSVKLEDDKIVVVFSSDGASSGAVVGTIIGTTITWGSKIDFDTNANCKNIRVALIDTNKIFISWSDAGNSYRITGIVGIVSGTNITYGTPVVVPSGLANNTNGYLTGMCKAGPNKIFFGCRYSFAPTYGQGVVATIIGTTITWGTPVVYDNNAQHTSCAYIEDDKVLISYRLSGSGIKTRVVSISGLVPNYGPIFSLSGLYQGGSEVIKIDTNKLAVLKSNWSSTAVSILTISGTTISEGTQVTMGYGSGTNLAIEKISTTSFIVGYGNFVQKFNISGTTLIGQGQTINGTMNSKSLTLYNIDKVLLLYNDGTTIGQSQIITTIPGYYKAIANFIGFASGSQTAGNILKILCSGLELNQSGLYVGQTYFVGPTAGTISLSGSIEVGTAVSEDILVIKN